MKLSKDIIKQVIKYGNIDRHTITVFDKNEKWLFLINYDKAVYSDCTWSIDLYNSDNNVVGKIDVSDILEMSLHPDHVKMIINK